MFVKPGGISSEKILVEQCCYDLDHIEKVTEAISSNFEKYFERYIISEAGTIASFDNYINYRKLFGIDFNENNKSIVDYSGKFRNILISSIEEFKKDRQKYIEIFDTDILEECYEDPSFFKSEILKKECPVIRKTLNSDVKELRKYKMDFGTSKALDLLKVVDNISKFAKNYYRIVCSGGIPEHISSYKDLKLSPLDKEERYTAFGVIGGGIKSHMLYKNYPSIFPNRSQSALWALYFLSGQKDFGCKMDSEFLMINTKSYTTQQNYFYPYELFSLYSNIIYGLICDKAKKYDVYINPAYKYVAVDSFLTFVSNEHREHINMLKTQIDEGENGYAYI